jgi:hypothetical protein
MLAFAQRAKEAKVALKAKKQSNPQRLYVKLLKKNL